jgi:peptidyl-tRNA hydrolase
VVIVGLGNCGSCTSWTIHDAVHALQRGRSTIAVATQHFEQLGRGIAAQKGRRGLRVHVLPYPLDTRPEAEVREIARSHYPALLEGLGVHV